MHNSNLLGIEGWSVSNARCEDDGSCYVKFWWYPEGSYQVLDTDYDTYAVVYGCDNWFFFYTHQAWLLSRSNTASTSTINTAKSVLSSKVGDFYDYDAQWLDSYQESDCQYD